METHSEDTSEDEHENTERRINWRMKNRLISLTETVEEISFMLYKMKIRMNIRSGNTRNGRSEEDKEQNTSYVAEETSLKRKIFIFLSSKIKR